MTPTCQEIAGFPLCRPSCRARARRCNAAPRLRDADRGVAGAVAGVISACRYRTRSAMIALRVGMLLSHERGGGADFLARAPRRRALGRRARAFSASGSSTERQVALPDSFRLIRRAVAGLEMGGRVVALPRRPRLLSVLRWRGRERGPSPLRAGHSSDS